MIRRLALSVAIVVALNVVAFAQVVTGWQTVYLDTGTEANARALAAQLGSDLQPGQFAAGDENYTFLAYTPLADHDDATWSFAVLACFNTDRPEGLGAYNAVLATSYVRTPANPSNVYQ